MNKICETCDTKNRLHLCDGREGNFKYCYRKSGSLDGVEETITPFNSVDELYDKLNYIEHGSLTMKNYHGEHMNILLGKYIDFDDKLYPIGFVIK
jgi:hypothetical protein